MEMKNHARHIISELRAHLPYTIFGVVLGMMVLGFLTFIGEMMALENVAGPSRSLFHIFHPIHLLFSATATTAMFWRHEKRFFKAAIIGLIGATVICGMSDIFIPFIAGLLLGVEMHLHICIIEHPGTIFPFVLMGMFAGFVVPDTTQKSTIFSHAAHVLVSSMASLLYLIGFGFSEWIPAAGMVFVYMVLAVIIPCCLSDIVFPLFLTRKVENLRER